MPNFELSRRNMVASQIRTNKVTDPRLIEAFETVPRELFVEPHLHAVAYVDEDLPLGGGRYLMEPMVLARMLQGLAVAPADVALDIGCASGYSSALLARLAATVVALESDPALAQRANDNLAELAIDNVVVIEAPLENGCPAQGPFDVIFLGGAVPEMPAVILDQLAEGGRICAVISDGAGPGKATLGLRRGGVVSKRVLFDAATPPLAAFEKRAGFVF